jgi:hypothetical protein
MVDYFYIFVANKNLKQMRKTILLMAAVSALAVSCSSNGEENTEEEAVEMSYTLDAENSSLMWAANSGPDYGHDGTVGISEGSLSTVNGELTEGTFTIDMNTIANTDIDKPEKAAALVGHLTGNGPDENHPVDLFFNVPAYPTVGVTLGDYADGKLGLTLDILGKELKQDVDVEFSSDDEGASIKGDFQLDLTSLEIPGLQPDPEDGSGINPVIDFKLDVKLTKE